MVTINSLNLPRLEDDVIADAEYSPMVMIPNPNDEMRASRWAQGEQGVEEQQQSDTICYENS